MKTKLPSGPLPRLVLFLLCCCAPGGGALADLRYPAHGNIRMDRGTIEMWLVPQFDPAEPLTLPYFGRRLFEIRRDDDHRLALMWRAVISSAEGRVGRQSAGLYPTGRSGGYNFANFTEVWPIFGERGLPWSRGEPKHVAFCWDEHRIWWILDGEIVGEGPLLLPLDFAINEDMELVIGDAAGSRFVFRDLRISSVPRKPSEVGYHHPEGAPADFHTLLLDRLDRVVQDAAGRLETVPVVMMSGPDGRGGGRLSGRGQTLETPVGAGLDL